MRKQRRRDGAKEAYWRGQVGRQARSGLGVRAFCRQQGLAENLFYAWRRELAVRDQEQTLAVADAVFAEVLVTAAAQPTSTAGIELILANQRRIAIAPGFDPVTLSAVLDLLEQRSC